MILFPFKPDRPMLLCFWLSLNIAVGLLIGIVSAYFISSWWSLLGLIWISGIFLIGMALPKLILNIYEMWNNAAGLFIRLSRFCLMAVCFYIVLVFTGRNDSLMNLRRPAAKKSMWSPWMVPETAIYSRQKDSASARLYQKNWISTFIAWAKTPRHLWAFSLLPFLILLRGLQTEQRSDFPTSIYTLY